MELSFLIVTAQLTESYIRWAALSDKTNAAVKGRLWRIYFLYGAASFFLYNVIFSMTGINATTYKAILMTGWLPYFLIGVHFLRVGLSQHVFVFGMGVICSLIQHTLCAIIILKIFPTDNDVEIILTEIAGYLLLFTIFLPICGYYFKKLMPSREFFNEMPVTLAIMPLVIVSGHLIRLADDVLVHSTAERLSRIYLPIVFLFFYHYILNEARNFYRLRKMERNNRRMEEQINDLKEYNERITAQREEMSVIRHDLRHSYNLIHTLLTNGETEKALEYIRTQKKQLEAENG